VGSGQSPAMLLFALGFPLVLLVLLAVMDWIEAPLRSDDNARKLPAFLDSAGPDEIEDFVRDGLKAALERHWLRQRLRRLVPHPLAARAARTGSR
jgi:hypothetical protein